MSGFSTIAKEVALLTLPAASVGVAYNLYNRRQHRLSVEANNEAILSVREQLFGPEGIYKNNAKAMRKFDELAQIQPLMAANFSIAERVVRDDSKSALQELQILNSAANLQSSMTAQGTSRSSFTPHPGSIVGAALGAPFNPNVVKTLSSVKDSLTQASTIMEPFKTMPDTELAAKAIREFAKYRGQTLTDEHIDEVVKNMGVFEGRKKTAATLGAAFGSQVAEIDQFCKSASVGTALRDALIGAAVTTGVAAIPYGIGKVYDAMKQRSNEKAYNETFSLAIADIKKKPAGADPRDAGFVGIAHEQIKADPQNVEATARDYFEVLKKVSPDFATNRTFVRNYLAQVIGSRGAVPDTVLGNYAKLQEQASKNVAFSPAADNFYQAMHTFGTPASQAFTQSMRHDAEAASQARQFAHQVSQANRQMAHEGNREVNQQQARRDETTSQQSWQAKMAARKARQAAKIEAFKADMKLEDQKKFEWWKRSQGLHPYNGKDTSS